MVGLYKRSACIPMIHSFNMCNELRMDTSESVGKDKLKSLKAEYPDYG